jgi:hypothetical protein
MAGQACAVLFAQPGSRKLSSYDSQTTYNLSLTASRLWKLQITGSVGLA